MAELETAAHAIFLNHPDAALSPYYEFEHEYRVFFLNGKCFFTYGKAKGYSWQHNLFQGAVAFEVSDKNKLDRLQKLAIRAADSINITFATIDIAELSTGEPAIMEINSGVQTGQLLEQLPHLSPIIKNIFHEAVKLLF